MANELETALRNVAEKVVEYVKNVSSMSVETRYIQVGADAPNGAANLDVSQGKPAALTKIQLDGDSTAIVPMRKAENGQLEVDNTLFELHERNVNAAIEYRAKLMQALLSTLQQGKK